MSRDNHPWIYTDLDAALRGDAARFKPPLHHCPQCGRDWLCSDRYTQDYCSPQSQFPGWNDITCHVCLAGEVLDEEDKAAWWLAHEVAEVAQQ